jgi:hypothetical protein
MSEQNHEIIGRDMVMGVFDPAIAGKTHEELARRTIEAEVEQAKRLELGYYEMVELVLALHKRVLALEAELEPPFEI